MQDKVVMGGQVDLALAMVRLVGGWDWGENPPACVAHQQQSQDTWNECVK